jgi:hypothetical protein
MYKKIILLLLILINTSINASSKDFSGSNLEFYKNKHIKLIKNKCMEDENPKSCMVGNIKHFYLGMKLLSQPHGDKYYKKCYEKNSKNGNFDYESINNCSRNYYNTLSYDFMGKKYNHIFLEEGYVMNNITQICTSNQGNTIDMNSINKCIQKQQKSYKFFKLNFFNSLSLNVEDTFLRCVKKYEYGNYSFNFTAVNSCIKKNTYNF